ncbi:Uncharacterised protein [Mycobacteroides abscessus subsp. abscessus]|nr:Uncharacterised protein [Mycobacteroides abscessus subsp. abscessus]
MTDLSRDGGAGVVDGIGEAAQPGDGLFAHPYLPVLGTSLGRDRAIGDGRHADSAERGPAVILDEIVGDEGVRGGGLKGGGLDGPVTQRDRTEPRGRQHVGNSCGVTAHERQITPCPWPANSGCGLLILGKSGGCTFVI